MRAAYITAPGPAGAIIIGPLPVPVPGPTDVLVAVEHVTVNPVDTLVRSGRYATPLPSPFIIGRDLVGRVVSNDREDLGFRAGDAVWANSLGHDGRQGSFAQYAVVPAQRLYRVPEGVPPQVALAVAHPAATAHLGWFRHAGLQPGDTVLVGGAAGNVGQAAVQLARRAGARVLATARPAHHGRVVKAGAEAVLDYAGPQLAQQVVALAPGGVDVVWDTSGHHDLGFVADVLRPGGTVLLTAAARPGAELPVARFYTRDITVRGFVISRASAVELAAAARLINDMLANRELSAHITEHATLADTPDLHARMAAGQITGRVVLAVGE